MIHTNVSKTLNMRHVLFACFPLHGKVRFLKLWNLESWSSFPDDFHYGRIGNRPIFISNYGPFSVQLLPPFHAWKDSMLNSSSMLTDLYKSGHHGPPNKFERKRPSSLIRHRTGSFLFIFGREHVCLYPCIPILHMNWTQQRWNSSASVPN